MPGTGSYSGLNVNADYIYNVSDALYELRDNTSQLIVPKDVRDSVWTLWNRIDDVQIMASQSLASNNTIYTNSSPTTVTVGGVTAGTTFTGTYSMQQVFDQIFYPYVAPVLSLSTNSPIKQFGSSLTTTLSWGVIKKKNPILSIVVNGSTITPVTGTDQSGTISASATHSLLYSSELQEVQTFTMSVGDGTSPQYKTTTITWQHKIYWGAVDLSSISNPNLTTNSGSASLVNGLVTDSIVRGLTGAGISPGWALTNTYVRSYNGISGGGKYLVFAHPTIFGTAPTFLVNGLPNSAFTKLRSSSFVTDTGISVPYDVWISNTAQNSPINLFSIK